MGQGAGEGAAQHVGDALKLLNRFRPFKLHQFVTVAGFKPADAAIGHPEAHEVLFGQFGDKRRSLAVARLTACVAGGGPSLLLQAAGESLEAQHQVVDHGSVLLSQTGKHGENRNGSKS
jgi:hypothetical protein